MLGNIPLIQVVEGPEKDGWIATGKVNKGIQQFQIIRNHMGPVGFLNLHNMKMFAKHRPEKWIFHAVAIEGSS